MEAAGLGTLEVSVRCCCAVWGGERKGKIRGEEEVVCRAGTPGFSPLDILSSGGEEGKEWNRILSRLHQQCLKKVLKSKTKIGEMKKNEKKVKRKLKKRMLKKVFKIIKKEK